MKIDVFVLTTNLESEIDKLAKELKHFPMSIESYNVKVAQGQALQLVLDCIKRSVVESDTNPNMEN